MGVLIVVAHPDDEVLGCGGTAALLSSKGTEVHTCILSGMAQVRSHRPVDADLQAHTLAAHSILGISAPITGDFPNIAFNSVPHLELVRFIEGAVVETGASTIFTHHPGDLNDDHRHTSLACQAAARLSQRRSGVVALRGLHFVEVLSSTDWSFAGAAGAFVPNAFVEIGDEFLERKIAALAEYEGVTRPYPHPRSPEVLQALAVYRGGQAGMRWAEAFHTVFQDLAKALV